MINCPTCGEKLGRAEQIIPGHVVLRCGTCRKYWLEGDDVWITFSNDPFSRLKTRADHLDNERRCREAMESPIDDPRWERIQ